MPPIDQPHHHHHQKKQQQKASKSSRITTTAKKSQRRFLPEQEKSQTSHNFESATFTAIPPAIIISIAFSVLFSIILINQSLRFQHDFAALQYYSSTNRKRGDHYVEYLQESSSSIIRPIQWKKRNYATHPVTLAESNYLNRKAATEHARGGDIITAAICHPTIFDATGNLNLDPFFAWVSYYRLLGFQHIFLWYEGNVNTRPRFQELADLSYVTLTRYSISPTHEKSDLRYHGQFHVERSCMSEARFAANYSWALPIDVDEYLWLEQAQSIQDFLAYYEAQNYTYISLGKYHYSTMHVYNNNNNNNTAAAAADSGFGLEKWPFTPGPYCFGKGGKSSCPTWMGRCKVLAKPSKFTSVEIHVCLMHDDDRWSNTCSTMCKP
jgi:Glycosyltransferase family 92